MHASPTDPHEAPCRAGLIRFQPRHECFIGIDSDGCIFDSMPLKQEGFFFPAIIETWRLETVADAVRETAAFVNLHSCWRGRNRFEALLKVFEWLRTHPMVVAMPEILPDTSALKQFLESGLPPGNDSLRWFSAHHPDSEFDRLLAWSEGINMAIADKLGSVPVFDGARHALEMIASSADSAVISQTPAGTLEREWSEAGLRDYVSVIAGQEAGSKAEQLSLATGDGRYGPGCVLMIGDAPGDLQAAQEARARFFPIIPGDEVLSWRLFNTTVLPAFLAKRYEETHERELVDQFERALPTHPPWER